MKARTTDPHSVRCMSAESDRKVNIRPATVSDAEGIVALYRSVGWPASLEGVTKILGEYAKTNYILTLVAEVGGRVIGKVTLDVVYPPYAEIVNLVVHPNYRRQSIGSLLIQECVRRAVERGFNVLYLMADLSNRKLVKFYAEHGFLPGIIGKDSWLYRFEKGSFVKAFLDEHPFHEFRLAKSRVSFHGLDVYCMKWRDLLTEDILRVYLKGQPGQPEKGGTMPRICGVSARWGSKYLEAWIEENEVYARNLRFRLCLLNSGTSDFTLKIRRLRAPGLSVVPAPPNEVTLVSGEETSLEFTLITRPHFNVPLMYLTFPTVVESFALVSGKLRAIISAGFNI